MQQQYGNPPPHGHPPQPGYGPPPGGPQPGYGHPPPGPAYGAPAPGYGAPQNPMVADLDNQAMTWLIVAAAGFFIGFGFVTGPIAWVMAGKLRRKYQSMGLPVSQNATIAWILGIASSAIYILAFISVMMIFVVFAGAVAAGT